jgi:hypothetical protein
LGFAQFAGGDIPPAVGVPDAAAAQRRPVLIFLDQVDVVLFNSALFISLLLAFLHLRQEAIASTQVEMQTLSGLLPICAWCKKVRDDDGYWREIADYFDRKGKLTHGICRSCDARMRGELT